MREVKFRGFAVSEMVNSQWLTGFGVYPIEFSKEYAKRTGRKKEMYLYTEDGTYQVQEKSIGQYTGLKDKNGVEIYEGDIVRHSRVSTDISIVRFGEFGVPNIVEMEYQDNALGFYYENASDLKDMAPFNMTIPLNREYVRRDEVIGNIYENPELLNG